jgi:hypothetical protein
VALADKAIAGCRRRDRYRVLLLRHVRRRRLAGPGEVVAPDELVTYPLKRTPDCRNRSPAEVAVVGAGLRGSAHGEYNKDATHQGQRPTPMCSMHVHDPPFVRFDSLAARLTALRTMTPAADEPATFR